MPVDYWTGLVSGFQDSREREYTRNIEQEAANRARSDRIFEYLLRSRDPEMQRMAVSGLMNPMARKKGWDGFLGAVESDPYAGQIVARMNEMIPEEAGGHSSAPIPPRPGSVPGGGAGMSTNQPVRLGSENIAPDPGGAQLPGIPLPPEPPPQVAGPGGMASGAGEAMSDGSIPPPPPEAATAAGPGGPPMGPDGIPVPPGPPMQVESKFKRRGTGVPTAEEIAEEAERRKLMQPVNFAMEAMNAGWFSEDDARRVMLDAAGLPNTARNFTAPTFAVVLPGQTNPVPVSFDTSTGKFFLADGRTPVPLGAKYVRMSGAGAGGGSMTGKIRDDAQGREQLIAMGADPTEVMQGSATGYWKYRQAASGELLIGPDIYQPPPAYTSTPTILDRSGNATVTGVTRGGGLVPLGTAPGVQGSNEQAQAQAILAVVRQRVAAASVIPGTTIKQALTPPQVDEIVRAAAAEANPPLPYTGIVQLEQAARVPASKQVTPRPTAPAGTGVQAPGKSMAEQVREELMKGSGMQGAPIPSPPGPPLPAPPSSRSRGAGPGPRR